jgi:hypothetical protein
VLFGPRYVICETTGGYVIFGVGDGYVICRVGGSCGWLVMA